MIRRRRHNTAPTRAALYASRSQLPPLGETQALQAQVDRCAADSLEHGSLVPRDQGDAEVQAGSARCERPALAYLWEAIRRGCIAVVMASSLDRLARDPAHSAILGEEFKAAGVTVEIFGA